MCWVTVAGPATQGVRSLLPGSQAAGPFVQTQRVVVACLCLVALGHAGSAGCTAHFKVVGPAVQEYRVGRAGFGSRSLCPGEPLVKVVGQVDAAPLVQGADWVLFIWYRGRLARSRCHSAGEGAGQMTLYQHGW